MNRSINLGPLDAHAAKAAKKLGLTLSQYVRWLIACDCGVEAPDMRPGNPEIARHARKAAIYRWGKKRK